MWPRGCTPIATRLDRQGDYREMTGMRLIGRGPQGWMVRWALGCVALSALAACQQSSPGQPSATTPAGGTVKPALTLVAVKRSVAMGTAATLQWSAVDAQTCTASGGW